MPFVLFAIFPFLTVEFFFSKQTYIESQYVKQQWSWSRLHWQKLKSPLCLDCPSFVICLPPKQNLKALRSTWVLSKLYISTYFIYKKTGPEQSSRLPWPHNKWLYNSAISSSALAIPHAAYWGKNALFFIFPFLYLPFHYKIQCCCYWVVEKREP